MRRDKGSALTIADPIIVPAFRASQRTASSAVLDGPMQVRIVVPDAHQRIPARWAGVPRLEARNMEAATRVPAAKRLVSHPAAAVARLRRKRPRCRGLWEAFAGAALLTGAMACGS